MKAYDWIRELDESIALWLEKVAISRQPGRFLPCLNGRTKVGNEAALGFSCFALRIYYVMGLWERLEVKQRNEWINFIQSFQRQVPPYEGAFVDPPILNHCDPWRNKIKDMLLKRKHPSLSPVDAIRIAETKQAIATLSLVGIEPALCFKIFPHTVENICNYLRNSLNWSLPWAAGGQAAALAVFVSHEAPKFLPHADVEQLKKEMREFFNQIVDSQTGGWYVGRRPSHGELINGAMKVLNALEWLQEEIPYPERLIDTCLSALPQSEGCHLMNAVYVLYQCSQFTEYRRQDIIAYCKKILEMIKHHQTKEAFSYFLNHNQTHYYGAKIANSKRQSDIHGTVLFICAISMLNYILDLGLPWNVVRP